VAFGNWGLVTSAARTRYAAFIHLSPAFSTLVVDMMYINNRRGLLKTKG